MEKSLKEDGTSADLIKEALREAVLNGKPNWKYIQAILRNWRHEGIRSVAQVEAKRQEREAKRITLVIGLLAQKTIIINKIIATNLLRESKR